jgi:hypothetical protein
MKEAVPKREDQPDKNLTISRNQALEWVKKSGTIERLETLEVIDTQDKEELVPKPGRRLEIKNPAETCPNILPT